MGRHFHLRTNKGVIDVEVFAICQALRIFDARLEAGQRYTVFSDSRRAIRWLWQAPWGRGGRRGGRAPCGEEQ